jgi:hypothetical protein
MPLYSFREKKLPQLTDYQFLSEARIKSWQPSMHDDLLDAQACVDWAISQLQVLQGRIEAWKKDSPYRLFEELHPERGLKLIKLRDIKPVPPIINAEAGAIVNSLRSSLDVLMNVLATRNGQASPREVQFPVCDSAEKFFHGRDAGRKRIKRLSAADQAIIESLKPWKGGNGFLYALHEIDKTRKHRRMLDVVIVPTFTRLWPYGRPGGLEFPAPDQWAGFKNDSVLAWIGIEATDYQIDFSIDVAINERDHMEGPCIVMALRDFASLTNSIIKRFDI